MNEAIEASGKCIKFEKANSSNTGSTYKFVSQAGNYLVASLSLNDEGLISGFKIADAVLVNVVINSWDDAVSRLNSFDGNTSLSIQNFGRPSKDLRSSEMHPLGSGFKLYILGALADAVSQGTLSWQDQFPITEGWKSLPSGIMHTWPNGKMVSLYDYAEHMIKISDNTATDHLLRILGRDRVEDQVRILKNNFVRENSPFLLTAEMFKLKWAAPLELIQSYLNGTAAERRSIIDNEIAQIPLSKVGTNGVSMQAPAHITEIEWFGSTNNLCSAMQGLRDKNSDEIKKALSQNVPFLALNSDSHWKYGGYKGGSEPGVLSMTYLLQSQSGEWGCVSVAWHNNKRNLNQWVFFDFIRKILKISEQEIR